MSQDAGHQMRNLRVRGADFMTFDLAPDLSDCWGTGTVMENGRSTIPVGHDQE